MRLNSIKLAGFKSFVDSTQILLQSNLTAIVGPNGCGKSNIVDAIHCVLGSASRNVRAELMTEVIFNGTTSRKPVGQASIELTFDNNNGRIAGELARYPEISIRREISRDGQSAYYLNTIRCRRKDITDIFLGTGLGNNNYAIIEQGMISRLIEAKPEELRLHVEEAAGTSKYKERRRETENRIRQTKENLARLNDIREEQFKQLQHLQRQANAAKKYKLLKTDQGLIQVQLQAIKWQELAEKIAFLEQKIRVTATMLEAKVAELSSVGKEIEHNRSARIDHSDKVNEIQGEYYVLGSEISQIEQQIVHTKERKKQLETDFEQIEQGYQEIEQQYFEDQQQIDELLKEVNHVEQLLNEARNEDGPFQNKLSEAEEKMLSWQESWDDFNHAVSETVKDSEVEKTKITHLEQKRNNLTQRLNRIQEEKVSYDLESLLAEVVSLQQDQKQCAFEIEGLQARLDSIQENTRVKKENRLIIKQELVQSTQELRNLQAEYATMHALQQIALGKDNIKKQNWLAENQLEHYSRLVENIEVEAGWEAAIEIVLANYLDAICIEDFTQVSHIFDKINNANICFFNINVPDQRNDGKKVLLSEKINSALPVAHLLDGIFIAEDLLEALTRIKSLAMNESIVTKDGIWLNQSMLRVTRQVTAKTGILQREQDLKALTQRITAQEAYISTQDALMQDNETELNRVIEEREDIHQHLQILKAKNSDLLAQIKFREDFIQQTRAKHHTLLAELEESKQQLIEVSVTLETARIAVLSLSQKVEVDKRLREQLLTDRDRIKIDLDQTRQQATLYKQRANEYQLRLEGKLNQINYLNQNMTRSKKQLELLNERRQVLTESLDNTNPLPELDLILQQVLAKRTNVEEDLSQAKRSLENIEANLLELEKSRQQVDHRIQEIRMELEKLRLDCQAFLVKRQTYEEQIETAKFSLQEVIANLPPNACKVQAEENLQRIENKIQRLGAINLAAIDEYSVLAEQKTYLDKQHADLSEALETLANAIRKIDRETRVRFKETFEQLNNSFKTFFLEIFGGGDANLELTSDDLLETGVIVKAQPPGKRNTTIYLLSGGEKALTAIALVFAIFNLNPAPFCVLDEVDAPLDDENIGRFCNLVRKMSEKIQFIFISHNKITIEMGQQLVGVTMQEPGVSRLVSVDMEQAIRFSENDVEAE